MMRKIWGAAGLAALALVLSACASSGSSSTTSTPAAGASSPAPASSSGGTALDVHTMGSQQVVTNSKGITVYWFAPDTSTSSKCTGSCATFGRR